jgi:hypothetical protein
MLNDTQLMRVIQQLCATAEVLGQEIKPTTAAMMAEDLARYPLDVIERSLSRLRSSSEGRLTLKAIVDVIEEGAGRLTANEAWAVALGALDESATVIWTDEIAQAWAVARPIMDAGDKIGARMAFIPAYDRLVKHAREEGRPVRWTPSLGWDESQRVQAINRAADAGLLSAPEAQLYLPPPDGPVNEAGRERVRGMLQKLSEELKAKNKERQRQMAEARQKELDDFERRKAKAVADALMPEGDTIRRPANANHPSGKGGE